MKTIHIFKAVAILFFTFSALSCDDLFNWGTRDYSTQLEIEVTKGGPALKAAADEPIYYLDDCELVTADAIRISIAMPDPQGGDPILVEGLQDKVLLLHPAGDGVASDQITLLPGEYLVTKFEVLQKDKEEDWVPILATPKAGSPFAGYIDEEYALPRSFSVELYEKKRLVMEVLCFEKAMAPSFGFTWTDFNVVQGDELCINVTCDSGSDPQLVDFFYAKIFTLPEGVEDEPYATLNGPFNGEMCFPLWDGATTDGVRVKIFDETSTLIADFEISAGDVSTYQNAQGILPVVIPCPD